MTGGVTLEDLRFEHYEPLVGQNFEVRWPDRVEQLVLTSAQRLPAAGDERYRAPFSLLFQGTTPGLLLHQQMQPLSHEAIGSHEIFLVPVGQSADQTFTYQATFA